MGLVMLPVAVYWPAIMGRFGMRDDYSILREAHEEPEKVIRVCSMQARPLYGVLMAGSFHHTGGIDDFWRLRLTCAVLIGGVAATFFLLLRRWNWDRWTALLAAALLTVLPSAQIGVGWAVAWPLPIAMLLAMAAFGSAERSFELLQRNSVPVATALWWALSVLLVTASALIYQSNSLFYFTAVAAALWGHRRWGARRGVEWLVRHVATVSIGLALAFTIMMVAFAQGWVAVSHRVALEQDWVGKFVWWVREPLKHALGLIALDDDAGSQTVHRVAALVAIVIAVGLARAAWRRGYGRAAWWPFALPAMVFASFAVNLIVADRWPVYRVLMPMSASIVVALAIALLSLGGRPLARYGLLALVVAGAWLARRQTVDLIAWPQSVELRVLTEEAGRIHPAEKPRVFVLTPKPQDHVAAKVFSDEFGSLSTDSDWVPVEMLKLVMRERYPDRPQVNSEYTVACGRELPKDRPFDVVLDLRRVREFRPVGATGR
jgi:hypothetical protein